MKGAMSNLGGLELLLETKDGIPEVAQPAADTVLVLFNHGVEHLDCLRTNMTKRKLDSQIGYPNRYEMEELIWISLEG
jgi:hypothetical protein